MICIEHGGGEEGSHFFDDGVIGFEAVDNFCGDSFVGAYPEGFEEDEERHGVFESGNRDIDGVTILIHFGGDVHGDMFGGDASVGGDGFNFGDV